MASALDLLLAAAALPVLGAALYLLVLTLASGRRGPPAYGSPRLRFDLVVPAHDEEAGIAATVESLAALDYPAALRRVIVVADNCGDATTARARAAGARVLERVEPARRGKGYALAFAFARILEEGVADAVVVVDADSVVSPNLLRAFAARLEAGAQVVQARYGVRNPDASWRTRLMTVAFALSGTLRALGRERLRCSAGIRGNGWCVTTSLLREVPHEAFSIVEDAEYALRLAWAGQRVWLADEAEVGGEMVAGAAGSASQRRRWEGGRRALARAEAGRLVRAGLRRRDRVLLDLGLDLLVPPLARLGAWAGAGAILAAALGAWQARVPVAAWPWGAALLALLAYLARGWWLSRTGVRGLAALARAPAYLAWKIGLWLTRRQAPDAWVRTQREGEPEARSARD